MSTTAHSNKLNTRSIAFVQSRADLLRNMKNAPIADDKETITISSSDTTNTIGATNAIGAKDDKPPGRIASMTTYSKITDVLPTRSQIVDHCCSMDSAGNAAEYMRTAIIAGRPLWFMPTSILGADYFNTYSGRGKHRAYVRLYGALMCGTRVCVTVENVPSFFDVSCRCASTDSDEIKAARYDATMKELRALIVNYSYMARVDLTYATGFHLSPCPFVRIYFTSFADRKTALNTLAANNVRDSTGDRIYGGHNMANCDGLSTGGDVNKLCREVKWNLGSWCRISAYSVFTNLYNHATGETVTHGIASEYDVIPGCEYNFIVSNPDELTQVSSEIEARVRQIPILRDLVDNDRTLVCYWDIETYKHRRGKVPAPGDKDYEVFMIGLAFYWVGSKQDDPPVFSVLITAAPCGPVEGIDLVIDCSTHDDTGNHHDHISNLDSDIIRPDGPRGKHCERRVLCAFIHVLNRMRPDIMATFNGGCFDWPIVLDALTRYTSDARGANLNQQPSAAVNKTTHGNVELFDDLYRALESHYVGSQPQTMASKKRWCFRSNKTVKILADVSHEMHERAVFKGVLDVDVMLIMKRYYPKAPSWSLNYFLKNEELGQKDDMPYEPMFRAYETAQKIEHHDGAASIERVAHYCFIDCVSLHKLMAKRCAIMAAREFARCSYTNLSDCLYNPDGMRVHNIIAEYAWHNKLAVNATYHDSRSNNRTFYPGGWVAEPNLGLKRDYPITALDFSSLYPSLIRNFNISNDRLVTDPMEAERLRGLGYDLHTIEAFETSHGEKKDSKNNIKGICPTSWTVRHREVINGRTRRVKHYTADVTYANGDKAKIICELAGGPNADAETRYAQASRAVMADYCWSGVDPSHLRTSSKFSVVDEETDPLPGESMGFVAVVVDNLFVARQKPKAYWEFYKKTLFTAAKAGVKTVELVEPETGATVTLATSEIAFRVNKYFSQQNSVKLIGNTTYGVLGDPGSRLNSLFVAGGVTTSGQNTIKMVARLVRELGFECEYGDTDSLYLRYPDYVFAKVRAEYESELIDILAAKDDDGQPGQPGRLSHEGQPSQPSREVRDVQKAREAALVSYWRKMVIIAMDRIVDLQCRVSEFLIRFTHSRYLSMSFEEVCMPTYLCGKKKYFGVQHLNKQSINFYPTYRELLVRGLDVVKQNTSEIARAIAKDFMLKVTSPSFMADPSELLIPAIKKFIADSANIDMFASTKKYNPIKAAASMPFKSNATASKSVKRGNVSVLSMVERIRAAAAAATSEEERAIYQVPNPGEKMTVVIVEKPLRYDLRGCAIKPNVGDKMELLAAVKYRVARGETIRIDHMYYFKQGLLSLLARFLCYMYAKQIDAQYPELRHEKYKVRDAKYIKAVSEYIKKLCLPLIAGDDYDPSEGSRRKQLFGVASKAGQLRLLESGASKPLAKLMYKCGGSTSKTISSDRNVATRIAQSLTLSSAARTVVDNIVNAAEAATDYPSALLDTMTPAAISKLTIRARAMMVFSHTVSSGLLESGKGQRVYIQYYNDQWSWCVAERTKVLIKLYEIGETLARIESEQVHDVESLMSTRGVDGAMTPIRESDADILRTASECMHRLGMLRARSCHLNMFRLMITARYKSEIQTNKTLAAETIKTVMSASTHNVDSVLSMC